MTGSTDGLLFVLGRFVLLDHRDRLLTAVPTSPGSTSADKNSLGYTIGPQHHYCYVSSSALSRETHTKGTPETPGTHVQKRLKRLLVRIGENLKRLMCGSVVAGTGQ